MLTAQEQKALWLRANGLPWEQVAEQLGITIARLDQIRCSVYDRLGVRCFIQAFAVAMRRGLLGPTNKGI